MPYRVDVVVNGQRMTTVTDTIDDLITDLSTRQFRDVFETVDGSDYIPESDTATIVPIRSSYITPNDEITIGPWYFNGDRVIQAYGLNIALFDVDRQEGTQPYIFRTFYIPAQINEERLRYGGTVRRFRDDVGTVRRFRQCLENNKDNIIQFMDPLSLVSRLPLEKKTVQATIKIYSEMSCVFLGLSLLFGKGKFLDYMRSCLELPSTDSFSNLPDNFVMCRDITALVALESKTNKSIRRGNELVPYLVQKLNTEFGEQLTHASSLTTEHIAHIALLLNINIHLLQEEVYKKTVSVIRDMGDRRSSGMIGKRRVEHMDTLRLLLDRNVPLYTSYMGASRGDSRTKTTQSIKVTDVLFLVSRVHGENMHIEPEFKVRPTMAFAAQILYTGFHTVKDIRTRMELENGKVVMSEGSPMWSGPLNRLMSSEMVIGKPFYSRVKLEVHPEYAHPKPLIIRTSKELDAFMFDLIDFSKEVDKGTINPDDQRPFGAIDVRISKDAFYPGHKEDYIRSRAVEMAVVESKNSTYTDCLNGKYFTLVDVLDEVVCRINEGDMPSTWIPLKAVIPQAEKSLQLRTAYNVAKDIENTTELSGLRREGASAKIIEEARRLQQGPRPSLTFMNVGISEFDIAFDSNVHKSMALLNISIQEPPNNKFAEALLSYHKKYSVPLVDKIEKQRVQAISDMEDLLEKLQSNEGANIIRIEKVKAKIKIAKENISCVQDVLTRTNGVQLMVEETILEPNQLLLGQKCKKGSVIMKRVATVYSPDQEVGMLACSSEWNDHIPYCTTARDYVVGSPVTKFDFKKQYTTIAQGGGNMSYELDVYGIDPHHLIPRNPHLQRLNGFPILSHFVDCGIINLDPSKVDIYKFRTMSPLMFRSSHNLYLTIATGTTKVINSVTLIQWTDQFCAENFHLQKSYTELACIFQFEILKLETGRFGFDPNIRKSLGEFLRTRFDTFINTDTFAGCKRTFGCKFINECISGEFGIEVKEQLKERLIVPCEHKIVERKAGVLCLTEDWEYTYYAKESCQIFLLHAQVFDYFQQMIGIILSDGTRVDNKLVKQWCNIYIGKLRKNKLQGWELSKETDTVELGGENDPLLHVRTDNMNPNVSVYHTSLPRAQEEFVHMLSAQMRSVRGHYDAFRSYIVRTGAKMIEVCATMIPVDDTVLLTRTDGIIVKRKHADLVEKGMKQVTYDIPSTVYHECSSILPGETAGYTRDDLSFTDMKEEDNCKKFILERIHREKIVEGRMGGIPTEQKAPSTVKSALDSMDKDITVNADEAMFEFYQTYERKKWMDPMMKNADVSTPAKFALYIATHLNPRNAGEFDLFSELFTARLVLFIEMYKKVVLTGPPGVGKSYLAKQCARHIRHKLPSKTTVAAVPFHMLRMTYIGIFDWCKTYQSLFGTGLNAEDAKYDPYQYWERKDKPHITENPSKIQISLLVLDEFQSFSVQTEELVKIACNQSEYVLICGDDYQQPNIGHTGMCLSGSIARTITNGVTINMNIEYRNPCPLYIASRSLTRSGHVQQYLSPDICDYYSTSDPTSVSVLNKEIISIAKDTKVNGFPNTVIACQNWDIAGMVVLQVVRTMLLLGVTSEHTLIHLGRDSTCDEMDDDENVDTNVKQLFNGTRFDTGRPKKRTNAHKQGVHGIPLLFFPGIIYVVTKTFRTHLRSKDSSSLEYLHQTKLLYYVRSEVKMVRYKDTMKRGGSLLVKVRYYIFKSADPITKKPMGEEIVLSCYETASYLLYPFITQQVSMIGLTLEKVTILQISSQYFDRKTQKLKYVHSYEPLSVRLKEIEAKYGNSSQYVRQCRQLQVALTRVPKGGKTKVVELDTDRIFYGDINLYCMSGSGCNQLCSLYTDYTNVDGVNHEFKFAIRQRSRICSVVEKLGPLEQCGDFIPRLEFPKDKLVVPSTLTIDDLLAYWFKNRKRKSIQ